MALAFGHHAFSLTSEVSPFPLTTIQGGDFINLTLHLDCNGTETAFLKNSTTCQELNKTAVFLNFVITFPVVLEIFYPANASNYSGHIVTDFSNCTFTPSLEIDSQIVPSDIPGLDSFRFNIFSQNVSWTATFNLWLKLLHSARAGSWVNITANAIIGNETKKVDVASFKTASPGNLQLSLTSTSIPATPNFTLTSDESVILSASFQLPRVTADLTLTLMLPTFASSTPMQFISGSVKSFAQGIVSQRLHIRDSPDFGITLSNALQFPDSLNIARFLFGETVNNKANDASNGIVTVEVQAKVESSQGLFVPETKGNVSCILMYYSSTGLNVLAGETVLTLELGQPLVQHQFQTEGSDCCFEGLDEVALIFEVKNPSISTAPVLNVSIDIRVLSPHVVVQNISLILCGVDRTCVDLKARDMMTNYSTGLNVNLARLNSSSFLQGRLATLVKRSVAAGSSHISRLSLNYSRTGWLPINIVDKGSLVIKSVAPHPPSVFDSDVPPKDAKVVTIGEDITFQVKVSLPVSTNYDFTVRIQYGQGVEGISGKITSVGNNIHGQLRGADLNVTASEVIGNFGTVLNTGNSSQLHDNDIEYLTTVRTLNTGLNTNGRTVEISFTVVANGSYQPQSSLSLKVIEPDLAVSVVSSRLAGVPPNFDLTFTVQLKHSKKSTSGAYRVLLEIAIPSDNLQNAQLIDRATRGSLNLVNGNDAPGNNPRYNNPNTKVLVFQADDLPLGQSVNFTYKATTKSALPPSIFVSSLVYLAYTTLPYNLSPREGRKYHKNSDQGTFLTQRPSPFVSVTFQPPTGSFDAGDVVQYILTLKNTFTNSTAYDLLVVITFEDLNTSRSYRNCSSGILTYNASSEESKLFVAKLDPLQTVSCNFTSFLQNHIGPKQSISQRATIEYYSLSFASYPHRSSYKELRYAIITSKAIDTMVETSTNAESLQAGDEVNFTFYLQIPEGVTSLNVSFHLPNVSRSVIDLDRKRRDLAEFESDDDNDRSKSVVKRSTDVVFALVPLLDESYVQLGNGVRPPNISHPKDSSLEIIFGLLENLPGSGANDTIKIFLKFRTANEPLVLSGRPFDLTAVLNFDAGSDVIAQTFLIVGPLLKPLLFINKTVQVLEEGGDSPLLVFNVTIGHRSDSLYHARDITVTDSTRGMDFYDSGVSSKDVLVRSPRANIFVLTFTLPSLKTGARHSFIYVARFKVDVKEPTTFRIPAEVTWKSVQLNSLTYRLQSDTNSGCLLRNNQEVAEYRTVFGYFALGVLLGLLCGAVIAAILVMVIIKCCDKGKMAPYYMRFTNTSTMTVLTGGSQYIYHEEDVPGSKHIEKHYETSIVQTDESIVPILALDSASQTEKELNSLDVKSTAALDADLETQRQNLFIQALKLLAKKLRVKREISSEQEKSFGLEIKQVIGALAFKMAAEYKQKSVELRKKLQREGKIRLDALRSEQRKDQRETENKIKGLVNEREKKNILELLKKRHEAQEQELKQSLKLEQDVEVEKLRKEVSISKRFALKEAQNKLIQNLIRDAKLNEEQANVIMKNHLANTAAIDQATDDERARRVMALEMRLAERRALAKQKQDEEERKKCDLEKLMENHSVALDSLVGSYTLTSEDAAIYLARFRKEVEAVNSKLSKDKKRQEQKLHQKLTALKQKKIEEKVREHQRQVKEFEHEQNDKFENVEFDTGAAISAKRKLLDKHRLDIEEIEGNSDKEAAEEIEKLRDQQTAEASQLIKNNTQKLYQELVNKGLSESEKEAILERHMADIAMQQGAREDERRRQRQMLERRLENHRAILEKKMKEEQLQQAEIRRQEDKIVGDLIVNQVLMSEQERDRIMEEHEKNLAELESSLTLNKLRQRQMLEEKLSERRKRRMAQLEKRQAEELKESDQGDKILTEGEDIEMIKKHEREKIEAFKEEEMHLEDEMEAVREEMLAERSKKLEAHHEKLGAIIAQLQIEKAKQMSKMAMQQEALGQLQAGLIDELESKGTFQDPETQNIMEKYQKDTKNLEENLKLQKEKQEQALRERLRERMKQREATLVVQQKDELSHYINSQNMNNMAIKLRKTAMKARHEKELNDLRTRMQREIDQSINELKMTSDIRRMEAIEAQNVKLISILVQQGKLQEEEIEGVFKYLFPTKSSDEIDELLSKIFGANHLKGSGHSLTTHRRRSTLEARIRRKSSLLIDTSPKKHNKKKRKSERIKDEQHKELPPITFKGNKRGLSLNESQRGYRSLTDDSTRSETIDDDDSRAEPIVNRKGSYQKLREENNQELIEEVLGNSPERDRVKSSKKRLRRVSNDGNDKA